MGIIISKKPKEGRMENFFKEKVELADGSYVHLRPLTEADTEKLYDFFLHRISEKDLMLFKDNVKDFYLIKRWTEDIDYERVFPVVAETEEGNIIGIGTLHMRHYGWSKDIGKIRLSICKECRGKGLGREIAKKLIEIAKIKGLRAIMAEVLSAQQPAIRALKKLGFEERCVIKELARDYLGNTYDLHILILNLEEEEPY